MWHYFLLTALVISANLNASQKKEEQVVHGQDKSSLKLPLEKSSTKETNKESKTDHEGKLQKWLNKYCCPNEYLLNQAIKMDLPSGYCYRDNDSKICDTFQVKDKINDKEVLYKPAPKWYRWQCAKFAKMIQPDQPLPGIAFDPFLLTVTSRNWEGRKIILLPTFSDMIVLARVQMIARLQYTKKIDVAKYIHCKKCLSDLKMTSGADKLCSIHKRFPEVTTWAELEKIRANKTSSQVNSLSSLSSSSSSGLEPISKLEKSL